MSEIKTENLPGNYKISGHVYSKKGAVLNGAKVTCGEFKTLTLADGLYVFDKLPSGSFEVKVSLKGFQSETKKITISETSLLDFYLDIASGNANINGYVYDSDTGKPIANKGSVILILPISNKYVHIDKNGYYEFSNLSAGTYNLSTSIPEYDDCGTVLTIAEGESKENDFICKLNNTVEPAWG